MDKAISRVSLHEAYFVHTYVRTGKICLFSLPPLTSAQRTGHIPHVDNRTCREHDVTTLPHGSICRQHRACVTSPSALYCYGYSSCVHRSLRSVIHHLDIRDGENTNITTPPSSTTSSGSHHERVADPWCTAVASCSVGGCDVISHGCLSLFAVLYMYVCAVCRASGARRQKKEY